MSNVSVEIEDLKKLLAELIQSQRETEARFKETEVRFKETDVRFKEAAEQSKKTDIRIQQAFDLFESQWGKLIESLVEGDLVRILRERGVDVHATSTRRKGSHGGENYELDIIAHNGDEIVVVEVKTTLRVKHVNRFLERLDRVKNWLPEYKNARIYGAVAFLRAEEESEAYAERQRLFVIRATGDSAAIVNQPGFEPRAF
jgi:Holliday junction resolvase